MTSIAQKQKRKKDKKNVICSKILNLYYIKFTKKFL